MRCWPEAAAGLKAVAQDGLKWLDPLIAGRAFIAGDRISLADILLFAFLDFGAGVGQPLDPANGNILRWYEGRSEEHTSELQSLMRTSYAVFCLTTKKITHTTNSITNTR